MPELNAKQVFATLQEKYANHYGITVDEVSNGFYLGGDSNYSNGEFVPSKEVVLNSDASAHSNFLGQVNIEPRKQQNGGSLTIGSQGRNTRTNDTKSGSERRVGEFKEPTLNEYQMKKKHFDFGVHDDDLDEMSEFPNWHQLYRQRFFESLSNDRQINAFWGKDYSLTSDLSTHPLLEDAGIGWRELLIERNPTNIFTGDDNGEVHIGKDGHYANLDHWVQDLYQGIPMHKRDAGMCATIGAGLMAMAEGVYFKEQGGTPTEKSHIKQKSITGLYGGIEAITADYFSLNDIMITSLKRNGNARANLSIFWQKGKWRRFITYDPKIERTVDWNARREANHIEDLEKIVWTNLNKVVFLDHKDSQGKPVEILSQPENKWDNL